MTVLLFHCRNDDDDDDDDDKNGDKYELIFFFPLLRPYT
jgi:hypothetical protein